VFEPGRIRESSPAENRGGGFSGFGLWPASASAPEDDLIQQQRQHGNQRPENVLAQIGLSPAEFAISNLTREPKVQNHCMADALLVSFATQDAGCGVEVLPRLLRVIPNETPRMGVAFAHDVTVAGGFVNGITHGITRGDSEFAQQQKPSPWQSIRNGPLAAVQKKTRQRRLVWCAPACSGPSQVL